MYSARRNDFRCKLAQPSRTAYHQRRLSLEFIRFDASSDFRKRRLPNWRTTQKRVDNSAHSKTLDCHLHRTEALVRLDNHIRDVRARWRYTAVEVKTS